MLSNKGVISRIVDDVPPSVGDAVINALDDGTLTDAEKDEIRSKVLVVDDERMPYYFNNKGEKVYADIMCNSSGAIRRSAGIGLR